MVRRARSLPGVEPRRYGDIETGVTAVVADLDGDTLDDDELA
jgi:hypothetical protein